MPAELEGETVILRGHVSLEEATEMAEWIFSGAASSVDLAGANHLHGAALQVLLGTRPSIVNPPTDSFVGQLVASLLPEQDTGRRDDWNTPG